MFEEPRPDSSIMRSQLQSPKRMSPKIITESPQSVVTSEDFVCERSRDYVVEEVTSDQEIPHEVDAVEDES